jgi:proteasome component ECM29
LRTLLSHVDSDAREAAARLLGIASSALSSSAALNLLSELTSILDPNHPPRYAREKYNPLMFYLCCHIIHVYI